MRPFFLDPLPLPIQAFLDLYNVYFLNKEPPLSGVPY